jgi:hypothetical protein
MELWHAIPRRSGVWIVRHYDIGSLMTHDARCGLRHSRARPSKFPVDEIEERHVRHAENCGGGALLCLAKGRHNLRGHRRVLMTLVAAREDHRMHVVAFSVQRASVPPAMMSASSGCAVMSRIFMVSRALSIARGRQRARDESGNDKRHGEIQRVGQLPHR